jgi:hypothetical protein
MCISPGIGKVGLKVEVKAPKAVYPKLREEPWKARSGEVHKLTGAEARTCEALICIPSIWPQSQEKWR